MKKWKRLLVSLLTVSMTLGASTMSVMADDTTPYTYKVTLSAGNKGTINGQNKIEKNQTLLPVLPLLLTILQCTISR